MKQPISQTSFTRFQRGLSLIEMMISITIGLLILASLSSLFISQSRARAELDKSNRMIDNGRYATELLTESLKLAGFFESLNPDTFAAFTLGALPDPCDSSLITNAGSNSNLLRLHVQGYDAATAASEISSPPCSLTNTAGSAESLKPGSDILVVRRASTTTFPQDTAANNGTIYLQVNNCPYVATPYLLSGSPGGMTTLAQKNIKIAGVSQDNCTVIDKVPVVTAPWANLRPFLTEVYFVSPDNNPGDGIPTLKRRELTAAGFVTTPLVEGIEYMQVEYGIDDPALDTDGIGGAGLDGAPDSYVSCAACTLQDWSNVVSVKLRLVARNIDQTRNYQDANTYSLGTAGTVGPFGDAYKRHAYTQQVRLVNPSSRRENPGVSP